MRSLPWPRDNERGAFQARGQMSGQDSEVPMPSCGNSSERAHSPKHRHDDFETIVTMGMQRRMATSLTMISKFYKSLNTKKMLSLTK